MFLISNHSSTLFFKNQIFPISLTFTVNSLKYGCNFVLMSDNPFFRPVLGELLVQLRKDKNLKQIDVARNLGHKRGDVICRYENGTHFMSNHQALHIIMEGFKIPEKEAKFILGTWLIKEAARTFGISVTIK